MSGFVDEEDPIMAAGMDGPTLLEETASFRHEGGTAGPSLAVSNAVPGCLSAAAFAMPERLYPSPGLEHLPFVLWLVDRLRPRAIAQLGTRVGCAYLAVCESVERRGLSAVCTAVCDRGERSDAADPADLLAYHDPRYGGFSQLVAADPVAWLSARPNGSVDLLLVQGEPALERLCGAFREVGHKLSDRAVMLLHPTQTNGCPLPVLAWSSALRRDHPGFSFSHDGGLDLVAVGPAGVAPLSDLFAVGQSATAGSELRAAYAHLGASLTARVELERTRAELAELRLRTLAREGAGGPHLRRDDLDLEVGLLAEVVGRREALPAGLSFDDPRIATVFHRFVTREIECKIARAEAVYLRRKLSDQGPA
jgi:hypothetical protein